MKPKFEITENSVRVILPNVLFENKTSTSVKENEIIYLFKDKSILSAKEISSELGIKKTQTSKYLGDLVSKKLVKRIGSGRNVKYMKD